MIGHESTETVADKVALSVLHWYKESGCEKKHRQTEWTVLAGIVLRYPSSDQKDAIEFFYRPLACATGNKCIGRGDLCQDGLIVNDCHAEILARRAFLRYLHIELEAIRVGGSESNSNGIFELNQDTQKYHLRKDYSLHLYISEAPCGDAAIYRLKDHVVQKQVDRRCTDRHTNVSTFRLTGAKRKRGSADKPMNQELGVLRLKSGRSDLPLEKQTLSMSCSDKIARWCVLGLEGAILSHWFGPIHLRSLVVSTDPYALNPQDQVKALKRAIQERLRDFSSSLQPMDFFLTSHEFPMKRDVLLPNERQASGIAIHWNRNSIREYLKKSQSKQAPHDKMYESLFLSNQTEVLVSARGLKQGAKKKLQSKKEKQTVCSRICKAYFMQAVALHHGTTINTGTTYALLKKSLASKEYTNARADFYKTKVFEPWKEKLRLPYKQFTLLCPP